MSRSVGKKWEYEFETFKAYGINDIKVSKNGVVGKIVIGGGYMPPFLDQISFHVAIVELKGLTDKRILFKITVGEATLAHQSWSYDDGERSWKQSYPEALNFVEASYRWAQSTLDKITTFFTDGIGA